MSIKGKVVIVTGAASGIGLATAQRLAKSGAKVTGVDVALDSLSSGGDQTMIEWYRGDVGVSDDMTGIVKDVVESQARVDALIACAGVADVSSLHSGDPQRWHEVLRVNTLGPMVCARAVLPHMIEKGHGDIVMVTSASGRITYVGEPAYVASKHAAVAFVEVMRKELAGTGIRVTSVEPGLVDTPMSRSHPFIDGILGSVEPLRPEDIADLIEYCLALPANVNINEVVIRPTRQEL